MAVRLASLLAASALVLVVSSAVADGAEPAGPSFSITMDQQTSGEGNSYGDIVHTVSTFVYYDAGFNLEQAHSRNTTPRSVLSLKPGEKMIFIMTALSGKGTGWQGDERKTFTANKSGSALGMTMFELMRRAQGASLRFDAVTVDDGGQGLIGQCGAQVWSPDPVFELSEAELRSFARVSKTVQLTLTGNENNCTGKLTARLAGTLAGPEGKVEVQGPGCLCGKDKSGEFRASASESGGTFEQFEVTASGTAPKVLLNRGGKDPLLRLQNAGKTTGRTRVVAVYRSGGERQRSEPFEVSFCEIEKPRPLAGPSGRNGKDYTYDSAAAPDLEIDVKGTAWLDGQDISDKLRWEILPNPGGLLQKDGEQKARMRFKATALPPRSTDFGRKEIVARVAEGRCSCQSEKAEVRTFFRRDATNNLEGKMPNWVYYWRQTKAGQGIDFEFVQVIPPGKMRSQDPAREVARYDPDAGVIYVSPKLMQIGCELRPDGSEDLGIDCFAVCLRHEAHHRKELTLWWGKGMQNWSWGLDRDVDLVPDVWELRLAGCSPKSKTSCRSRPPHLGKDLLDIELNAYNVGWTWDRKTATDEDWAAPGKQWPEDN